MLANGTWVEFTSYREMSDGELQAVEKATGVVVDSYVLKGIGYYMVQHYEDGKPGPEPSLHPVRDDPRMIRALTTMPRMQFFERARHALNKQQP